MRVTLVNAQVLDGNNVVPPLGLMYIAAVLEKAGHAVQIYDSDPEYQASMIREIKDFNPDLILERAKQNMEIQPTPIPTDPQFYEKLRTWEQSGRRNVSRRKH